MAHKTLNGIIDIIQGVANSVVNGIKGSSLVDEEKKVKIDSALDSANKAVDELQKIIDIV